MNQKGFVNIILIVVIVILVGTAGYFTFVKKSGPIAQQPTPTPAQTKTPISPTPKLSDGTGSTKSSIAAVRPEDPNKAGLAPYPDLSITSLPTESVSVKFVVEHRSALNSKSIKVRGVIVGALLGENACPPDRGMCAQPSIFLADAAEESRNKLYDLRMLVNEEEQEKNYPVGKIIEVQVIVDGNKVAVIGRKTY